MKLGPFPTTSEGVDAFRRALLRAAGPQGRLAAAAYAAKPSGADAPRPASEGEKP